MAGRIPGAKFDAPGMGLAGIAHAQRHRRDHRLATHRGADPGIIWVGIEDQVHAALAVQGDLTRAVAGHRPEAHVFQHLPQRLWPAADVLDEFNAVNAQPIDHLGHRFTVHYRWVQGR